MAAGRAAAERFGLRQIGDVSVPRGPAGSAPAGAAAASAISVTRASEGESVRATSVVPGGADAQLTATTIRMTTSSAMMIVVVEMTTVEAPPTSD